MTATSRPGGAAGTASGGRRSAYRARHISGVARPPRERGGAQRPHAGFVRRAVRGPGQLQAGERPVRPRGGQRDTAAGSARVRVAYAPHRPGGALRRGRVRDGAGAHGGGGGRGGGGEGTVGRGSDGAAGG